MATSRESIGLKFQNNDIPNQGDFQEIFESFVHKDDKATIAMVDAGIDDEHYVTPALLRVGLQNIGAISGGGNLPYKQHVDDFDDTFINLDKYPIESSVKVFKNGQLLLEGEAGDYMINYETAIVTFPESVGGRNIEIDYWYRRLDPIPGNGTNYVDLTTAQTIAGNKIFAEEADFIGVRIDNGGSNRGLTVINNGATEGIFIRSTDSGDSLIINDSVTATGTPLKIQKDDVTKFSVDGNGQAMANSFVKTGGTSTEFLKADGSVDSSIYAPTVSPTFTGTVVGITKSMVGLANVDNTPDANKPVSTATQTALDTKQPIGNYLTTAPPLQSVLENGNIATNIGAQFADSPFSTSTEINSGGITSIVPSLGERSTLQQGVVSSVKGYGSDERAVRMCYNQMLFYKNGKTISIDITPNDFDVLSSNIRLLLPHTKSTGTYTLSTLDDLPAPLGFTPENIANKSNSYTASSTTTYASTKALVDGLSSIHSPVGLGLSAAGASTNGLFLNGQVLFMQQASSTNIGSLSSTDWNNFNSKATDSNVLHKTGDETVLGRKTFNSSDNLDGTVINKMAGVGNGLYINANSPTGNAYGQQISASLGNVGLGISNTTGSDGLFIAPSSTAGTALKIVIPTSGSVRGLDIYSNAGTSTGNLATVVTGSPSKALYVANTSTGTGNLITANSVTGGTGNLFVGQNNYVNTSTIDKLGNVTANSFIKSGGTSSQFLKADGSVDSNAYLPLTGGTISGSLTSTTFVKSGGTSDDVLLGDGTTTSLSGLDGSGSQTLQQTVDLSNTIAIDNTGLGIDITATNGAIGISVLANSNASGIESTTTSGNPALTATTTSSTNGGYGLLAMTTNSQPAIKANGSNTGKVFSGNNNFSETSSITKEGVVTATSFVKSGGTSSQFLKANGSVDSNAYLPLTGGTISGSLTSTTFVKSGSTSDDILLGDGTTTSLAGISAGGSSPLGMLDEGNGNGYRLSNANPLNFGNIGADAVDLSYSETPSNVLGATGSSAFAMGSDVTASNYYSTVFGYLIDNNGIGSFDSGFNLKDNGYTNSLFGIGHDVTSMNTTVVGQASNIISDQIEDFNYTADKKLFVVGNGTIQNADDSYTVNTRSDALVVRLNGSVEAPSLTNALIEADTTGKTLVTKEYAGANYTKFGSTAPSSATDTGVIGEVRITSTYVYYCIAANTWVRAALATW